MVKIFQESRELSLFHLNGGSVFTVSTDKMTAIQFAAPYPKRQSRKVGNAKLGIDTSKSPAAEVRLFREKAFLFIHNSDHSC